MFKKNKVILDIDPDIISIESSYYNARNSILDDAVNNGKFPFIFKTGEHLNLPSYNHKNLNIQEVTLKAGDNVYFIPGVSVPRYKFKDKGDEVGFKTKRSISAANIVVIDEKIYTKYSQRRNWGNSLNSYELETVDSLFEILGIDSVESLVTEEELETIRNNDNKILVSGHAMRLLRNCTVQTNNNSEYSKLVYEYNYEDCIIRESNNEDVGEFVDLLESIHRDNKTLVSAECIMSQITSSVKLTEKMYNRLNQMLESDAASRELAVETLTNLEINKNTMFELFRLINSKHTRIYNTKAYNQVAFKAFRNTLDSIVSSWRHGKDVLFNHEFGYPDYLSLLGTLKVLKEEHVRFFLDDIKRDFKTNYASQFFKIEKIQASDMLKNYLEESKENLKSDEYEEAEV